MTGFSFSRLGAMLGKEWRQMRRDPMTIRLTLILPMIQLFLFGFAINANPRHLPTAVVSADHSIYERDLLAALTNTKYFDLRPYRDAVAADTALRRGQVLFVIEIPPNFAREVMRGAHPQILVDADASDPVAIGSATAALSALNATVLSRDLPPDLRARPPPAPPFQIILHARYNPEQITALNIVPGLIAVILTISTLVLTSVAITREREAGTLENLLAMPVRPIEVALGKIVPYVGLGYAQTILVLALAVGVFGVPVRGSVLLLLASLGLFIACNLALGLVFSALAQTQMQAQQMAQFAFLPSMMLSGFLYPFAGMPGWARAIGVCLPITHALRIARGILLKGNGFAAVWPDLWPMGLFALVMGVVAVRLYRETLD